MLALVATRLVENAVVIMGPVAVLCFPQRPPCRAVARSMNAQLGTESHASREELLHANEPTLALYLFQERPRFLVPEYLSWLLQLPSYSLHFLR